MSMTKSELINVVAKRAALPRKRAVEVVNIIFERMTRSLVAGDRIEMRGFGTFQVKNYRAYIGRNPRTGEEVPVAPKRAIQFKVGKELRERVDYD